MLKHQLGRLHAMLVICLILFVILIGRMAYLHLLRGD